MIPLIYCYRLTMGIPNSFYTLLLDLGLPVAALALCIAGNADQSMQVDGDDHYGT